MHRIQEIPESLVIGYIDNKDVKIISLDYAENTIEFETIDQLRECGNITLYIFDISSGDYVKYIFEKVKIVLLYEEKFRCVFKAILSNGIDKKIMDYLYNLITYAKTADIAGVNKNLTQMFHLDNSYPIEMDEIRCDSFEEQKQDWFDMHIHGERDAFRMPEDVELAYSINNNYIYHDVLKYGIQKTIDYYLTKDNLKQHPLFSMNKFKRIYVGNEFCFNLYPKKDILFGLLNKIDNEGYCISVNTPYLRQGYVRQFIEIANDLDKWAKQRETTIEIVVNDFGLLKYLNQECRNCIPVYGRLLNKRKKDNRMKWKWGIENYTEKLKKNNLNEKSFQASLKKLGINRYEFECHLCGNEIPEGRHSLHFPFFQISTSQYCTLVSNMEYFNFHKQQYVTNCCGYCNDFYGVYPKHLQMIAKGNSVFGYNQEIMRTPLLLKEYIKSGIDRLVYTPLHTPGILNLSEENICMK